MTLCMFANKFCSYYEHNLFLQMVMLQTSFFLMFFPSRFFIYKLLKVRPTFLIEDILKQYQWDQHDRHIYYAAYIRALKWLVIVAFVPLYCLAASYVYSYLGFTFNVQRVDRILHRFLSIYCFLFIFIITLNFRVFNNIPNYILFVIIFDTNWIDF